jgi:hypothetical protein
VLLERMVVIVRLVVVAADPGVTCVGLKTQLMVESSPVQLKEMLLPKLPLDGVSVTVNVAELPAATVAVELDSVCEKSSPIPDSEAVAGVTVPLFAMEIVAVRVPVSVGLNATFRTQVPDAATVLLQEFVCEKSLEFVPVKVIPVIEIAVDPELVRVRLLAALAVFSAVLLNVKEAGLGVKVPVLMPLPTPAKLSTCPPAESVSVSVAVKVPFACGRNVTASRQLPPCAIETGISPQLMPLTW